MAWTDAEERRITAIEEKLNEVQIALSNCASRMQLRQAIMLIESEIQGLTKRIESLESQVSILQTQLG